MKKVIFSIYHDEEPCEYFFIRLQGNSTGYVAITENSPFDSNQYIMSNDEALRKFNNDTELKNYLENKSE